MTLYSCSNDNNNSVKLLKVIVDVSADGNSTTTFFAYNGNEISSIDGFQEHMDFTYTNGLITKIVSLDKKNKLHHTLEYTYVEGQVVGVKSPNNYIINYSHNLDGTVLYEKLAIDSGIQKVKNLPWNFVFSKQKFNY